MFASVNLKLPVHPPSMPRSLATTSLFSVSVSLFLFHRWVYLCHILDPTYKWYYIFVFLFVTFFIQCDYHTRWTMYSCLTLVIHLTDVGKYLAALKFSLSIPLVSFSWISFSLSSLSSLRSSLAVCCPVLDSVLVFTFYPWAVLQDWLGCNCSDITKVAGKKNRTANPKHN